ncbi:phosphatidylinositol 5-phosphate 4-kinase [Anaeramoeba flamelloides]|uniref:Phosphatidylinositol 5-phosphate 4-kinase n=1 Tax=Anaeramoeba flamelloides TaxID=1746091 RepID=A0ABQ8YPW8_9EUKA|nr:phosphatidylinositol 5-phosphate 4-kinase [Anaeramoeba flamelloides]
MSINKQQENSSTGVGFFSSLSSYFRKSKFQRYDSVKQILNQGLSKLKKKKKKKTQISFTQKSKKHLQKQKKKIYELKKKQKTQEKENEIKKTENGQEQEQEQEQKHKQEQKQSKEKLQKQNKEKVEKEETQTKETVNRNSAHKTKLNLKVGQENFEQFDPVTYRQLQKIKNNEEKVLKYTIDFTEYHSDLLEKVRESQGISTHQYRKSIKTIKPMLTDSGRSGAFFFRSKDAKYVVKSVPKTDSQVLKQILPDYLEHLLKNPSSLINPIYGHYKLKTGNFVEYYIIMANVFQSDLSIDRIYDLKGSTVGRENSTENENGNQTNLVNESNGIKMDKVLKDNDLDEKIEMSVKTKKMFIKQLESDLGFLQKHELMDYSLLVGVHHLNQEQNSQENTEMSINKLDVNTQLKNNKGNQFSNQKKNMEKNNENKDGKGGKEKDSVIPSPVSFFKQDHGGLRGERPNCKNEKCIYYMGIIDMLQFFSLKKAVESGLKGLFYGDNISSVDPETYSRRFMLTMLNLTNSKNDEIDFKSELKKYSEPKVEENTTQETQSNTGFFSSFFNRAQPNEQQISNNIEESSKTEKSTIETNVKIALENL